VEPGFAVWITGLPASGKSTLASALVRALKARGVAVAVLESDSLRRILTPHPRYTEEERDVFYGAMVYIGRLLTEHGIPVIFDATGHRREYRDRARAEIRGFIEVYVECPMEVCVSRDPKGIYRKARAGAAATVPGVQAPYQPPEHPEVVVRGDQDGPDEAARRVVATLMEKGYLAG
jgi:adenylylsulfate kinase